MSDDLEDFMLGLQLGVIVIGAGGGVGIVLITMHIVIDWYINLGGM